MPFSDVDEIQETQMYDNDQLAEQTVVTNPNCDSLDLVRQFKAAADRSYEIFQLVMSHRQAISTEEETTKCLLQRRNELSALIQQANEAVKMEQQHVGEAQKRFEFAQEAVLAAQKSQFGKVLQVHILNSQLQEVAKEITASQQRAGEKRQALQSICTQKRS